MAMEYGDIANLLYYLRTTVGVVGKHTHLTTDNIEDGMILAASLASLVGVLADADIVKKALQWADKREHLRK